MNKGSELYNRSMKLWLQDNDIERYLTHNEQKPIVKERSRTLRNTIIWLQYRKIYIDKLDDIVNKGNNTFHSRNKMEHPGGKSNIEILKFAKRLETIWQEGCKMLCSKLI